MNIFALDRDPYLAAAWHCDKHCVKMILESAQLLCTAHHELGTIFKKKNLLLPTHVNHPCALWVRQSGANYIWLATMLGALCQQFNERYGHDHKYVSLAVDLGSILPTRIPTGVLTDWPQCMPDMYKRKSPIMAYRAYYFGVKRAFAKWRNGSPRWWQQMEELEHAA